MTGSSPTIAEPFEKRLYRRTHANVHVRMHVFHSEAGDPAGEGEIACETENISVGGVLLRTERVFPVGTLFELSISIDGDPSSPVLCLGRSVHIGFAGAGHYDMGVIFLDLLSSDKAKLEEHVKRAGGAAYA